MINRPKTPRLPFEETEKTPSLILRAWDEDDLDPVEDYADLAGIVRGQDDDW